MSFLSIVRLSLMKRLRPILTLALGLVFLDQVGLGHSGPCWLMYHGPLGLLSNRCPETPQGYNPDNLFYKLTVKTIMNVFHKSSSENSIGKNHFYSSGLTMALMFLRANIWWICSHVHV